MLSQDILISLGGVTRLFDSGAIVALEELDLSIEKGDRIAIVGASGSGKSTLVNLLSGIDVPTRGCIRWKGQPVTSRKQWAALRGTEIGIVFQDFNLLPTLTAGENVELAMFGHGLSAATRRARATEALERVGLAARVKHLPHALSGGERQRVAIARSIVNEPSLLLADEPTGNLDSANAARIVDLIFDLQRTSGATLVFVTHDDALARRCRRQVRIKDGRIVEDQEVVRLGVGGRETAA
ncbi:MAG: ABC transporter ATP-binding protein [Xanthobacteraceae bacterium]